MRVDLGVLNFLIITVEEVVCVTGGEWSEVFICESGLLEAVLDWEDEVILTWNLDEAEFESLWAEEEVFAFDTDRGFKGYSEMFHFMSCIWELNETKIFSQISIRVLRSSDKLSYVYLHQFWVRAEILWRYLVSYLPLSGIEEELELDHVPLGIFGICYGQLSITVRIDKLVSLSVLPWDKLTII